MTLTAHFARHIAEARPEAAPEALAAARDGVLDFLACAFAGAEDPSTSQLWRVLAPAAGAPVAQLIGRPQRVDLYTAALVNGHAGHALDYDDVHASVRGHPSTVILPALLALAETRGSTAHALLNAYVVGVEAMARLGLALGSRHYELGFHSTATLGTVGTAAAAAHLLGLDAAATANALGLAATQSAGLRLQFGTDAKPLHAGLAARSGLLAASLAEAGLAGSPAFADGPIGFLAAYGAGAEAPERLVEGFGAPWQIVAPGLIFKEFACCTGTHCAAEATLALRAEHAIDPAQVTAVTVTFPPGGDAPLVVQRPATGTEGRFSVEYVVARALIDGRLPVDAFDERPVEVDSAHLLAKVARRTDAAAPPMSNDARTRFSVVEITLADGRSVSRRVAKVRGASDLRAKFLDAAGPVPARQALPDLIARMESAADLAALFAGLASAPSSSRRTAAA